MSVDFATLVTDLGRRARAASLELANVTTQAKNDALLRLADLIEASSAPILAANRRDLDGAAEAGLAAAQVDRLTLDAARLKKLAASVREVAALPDPVGTVLEEWTRPNGPPFPEGAGSDRSHRDHLRGPAERDDRLRRALPEVRAMPPSCAAARRSSRPTRSWPISSARRSGPRACRPTPSS